MGAVDLACVATRREPNGSTLEFRFGPNGYEIWFDQPSWSFEENSVRAIEVEVDGKRVGAATALASRIRGSRTNALWVTLPNRDKLDAFEAGTTAKLKVDGKEYSYDLRSIKSELAAAKNCEKKNQQNETLNSTGAKPSDPKETREAALAPTGGTARNAGALPDASCGLGPRDGGLPVLLRETWTRVLGRTFGSSNQVVVATPPNEFRSHFRFRNNLGRGFVREELVCDETIAETMTRITAEIKLVCAGEFDAKEASDLGNTIQPIASQSVTCRDARGGWDGSISVARGRRDIQAIVVVFAPPASSRELNTASIQLRTDLRDLVAPRLVKAP